MKQTAIFLLLIGVVLRLRGCVVLGGSVSAARLSGENTQDVTMQKLGLVAQGMSDATSSLTLGWWFLGAGVVLLFGSMLWPKLGGSRGALKALESRHVRTSRRR
ncbi:MAG: hypothetical protein IAE77_30555 [Prosthecobacter sp.]|uniref:hypothetical protein n=1 Tax=Prosthecobacter sp. TaxID=1965333 RepID=UPI001A04BCE5|nr:hypothetical protein [Prosthecobacter sp.]MBE2287839.1 hypothetical protein [Prosthecobacter sp.]